MKYMLLSIEGESCNNIGDYIQALAAAQFLPRIDGFVNREELSKYDGDECKIIMNGWYMHHPENWPPSPKIHPLFVALHINKLAVGKMLDEHNINYLKTYEPIGCRDYYTCEQIKSVGVKSWFSGCLTLTLGNTFRSPVRDGAIYFVDPVIPRAKKSSVVLLDCLSIIKNPVLVSRTTKKMKSLFPGLGYVGRLLNSSRFIRLYSTLFSTSSLGEAVFINQQNSYYSTLSNEDRLREAERLVRLYSKAKFIVTSRIHCALPCLGLQTPVYFTRDSEWNDVSVCRFGGLIELFNTITIARNRIVPNFNCKGVLSSTNVVPNKSNYQEIAERLTKLCNDFIQQE